MAWTKVAIDSEVIKKDGSVAFTASQNFPDTIDLQFGTSDDITIQWDGTRLVVGQLTADSEIRLGIDGAGIDQRWYGDDAGAYMLWDQSENQLLLNLVDKSATDVTGFHIVATLDGETGWYYGVQSDVHKSGAYNIDDCYAGTFYMEILAGDFTTTGRVAPLCALISGTGTAGVVTGEVYAAWIANRGTISCTDAIVCLHNQSAATATAGLLFDIDGTVTYAFQFNGTVSDGWTSGTGAIAGSSGNYAKIPVFVEGVTGTLYLLAAAAWA